MGLESGWLDVLLGFLYCKCCSKKIINNSVILVTLISSLDEFFYSRT